MSASVGAPSRGTGAVVRHAAGAAAPTHAVDVRGAGRGRACATHIRASLYVRAHLWAGAVVADVGAHLWAGAVVTDVRAHLRAGAVVTDVRAHLWAGAVVADVRAHLWAGAVVADVRAPLRAGAVVADVRAPLRTGAVVADARAPLWAGAVVADARAPLRTGAVVGVYPVVPMVVRLWLAQYLMRIFMNRRVQAPVWPGCRAMPRGMVGRRRYSVNVGRVVPVPMVPRGRTPVRYKAQCREGGYREDGSSGGGIAIYGASVVVTVYREPIGIVAGTCPGNG